MSHLNEYELEPRRRDSDYSIEGLIAPPLSRTLPKHSVEHDLTSLTLAYKHSRSGREFDDRQVPFRDPQAPAGTTQLPPVDRGRKAWQFLLAAFTVETLIWGFPSSYGVLLDHYLRTELGQTENAHTLLPLSGTLNSGIMFFGAPFIIALINRYPHLRRNLMWAGFAMCVTCLIAASFATQTWQLVLSQGVGYGLGGCLVYFPTISYLTEWFVERRGFANGVIFAGTALGGLVLPLTLESLLQHYGAATTLRILAGGEFVLLVICLPSIHGRIPISRAGVARPSSIGHFKALKQWRFWVYIFANTLQGLAFFLPSLYLPSFAQSLSMSSTQGSAALAAMNAASIVSRLGMGLLSDRFSPHLLGSFSVIIASLAVLILWGVTSTSMVPLMVFSIVYGIFGGGWSSLSMRVCGDFSFEDRNTAVTLYGLIAFTCGLGNIMAAPISSALLQKSINAAGGYSVNGGSYTPLILFCGLTLGGAGVVEGVNELAARRKGASISI